MFHDKKLHCNLLPAFKLNKDSKFNYLRTAGHFKSESGFKVPNLREMIGPMAVLPGFSSSILFDSHVDLAQEPGQFELAGGYGSDVFYQLDANGFYLPSFCAVVIGGGGAGSRRQVATNGAGGGGGALVWANNLWLPLGGYISFQAGHYGNNSGSSSGVHGGLSVVAVYDSLGGIITQLVAAPGIGAYQTSTGGSGGTLSDSLSLSTNITSLGTSNYGGGDGGTGGNSSTYRGGGGGAGGYGDYAGNNGAGGTGGNGSSSVSAGGTGGNRGTGGGGGTGSVGSYGGGGGGGVGLYGGSASTNGSGGSSDTGGGGGGSNGGGSQGGAGGSGKSGVGGDYGGGGGGGGGNVGGASAAGNGGPGGCRIMWGSGRSYPSTGTGDV